MYELLGLFGFCPWSDIRVDRPLKDTMVIAIPYVEGSGSYLHTIKVEYEVETDKMRKLFGVWS